MDNIIEIAIPGVTELTPGSVITTNLTGKMVELSLNAGVICKSCTGNATVACSGSIDDLDNLIDYINESLGHFGIDIKIKAGKSNAYVESKIANSELYKFCEENSIHLYINHSSLVKLVLDDESIDPYLVDEYESIRRIIKEKYQVFTDSDLLSPQDHVFESLLIRGKYVDNMIEKSKKLDPTKYYLIHTVINLFTGVTDYQSKWEAAALIVDIMRYIFNSSDATCKRIRHYLNKHNPRIDIFADENRMRTSEILGRLYFDYLIYEIIISILKYDYNSNKSNK